jgi:hypothetical protein
MEDENRELYQHVISNAFNAICLYFDMKDYQGATELTLYLEQFSEYFTETQEDQLRLTIKRLTYLLRKDNDNQPST